MPEPLTVPLGIAITKSVAKVWLGDDWKIADIVTDTLAELANKVVPDWQARSALKRQLEKISEKSAAALEPLIEVEFSFLPRGEKLTAIFQVGQAINQAQINLLTLIKIDYDLEELSSLLSSCLDDSMLCEGAKHLAERLTRESSALLIDLSSAMPQFERNNFAEILKRETDIALSVDRMFAEIEQIRSAIESTSSDAKAEDFEIDYRRAVRRRLDRIELFGLNNTRHRSSRSQTLSTAYISLSVTGSRRPDFHNLDAGEGGAVDHSHTDDEESLGSIRAEEAALISNRVVVKGEAGSGKTTLLQSLAVRAASADFKGPMAAWNNLVPFFVPLRSLVAGELPRPESLPGIIAPSIAAMMPSDWVHHQLRSGRGLLLVDGLDEVSEERREETKIWIADIAAHFPDTRILMTSRPSAIPGDWLENLQFAEVELLPMSPDDVSMFIEHWHFAVSREEIDEDESNSVLELASPLRERIRSDRSLRELAATPLLCAMLCAMNRDRKEVLPSNRIALYEAATQLVLHGRDVQRKVRIEGLPDLDFETKRDLIQSVALWMMENGWSMVEVWRIEDHLQGQMAKYPRIPSGVDASILVKALILRSGILRSPIVDKCDFIHNAFKEYLCARAISDEDKFGFLVDSLSRSEAWREVAPMAAAITDDRRRSEFIREILKRGDLHKNRRSMYYLLAVRCLETCTKMEPELQTEIHDRIQKLRPPSSITEAKALSAAGDLAIDLVRKASHQHARPAACCVRTLRMVGSEKALEALIDYGPDYRGTVVKELLAAWPFFDRKEYARRVLSQSRGLWGGLRLDNLESLEGVGFLTKLPRLRVYATNRVFSDQHYAEIDNLNALEQLEVRIGGSFDIARMGSLPNLKSIVLAADALLNIGELKRYRNLYSINLVGQGMSIPKLENDKLSLLSILGNYDFVDSEVCRSRKLRSVTLLGASNGFSLAMLGEQPHLNSLHVPAETFASTKSSLCPTSRITELSLSKSEVLENLSVASDSKSLRILRLYSAAGLVNLKGVSKLAELVTLDIRGGGAIEDLSELIKLPIRNLTLGGLPNGVDLSPIASLARGALVVVPTWAYTQMQGKGEYDHLTIRSMVR